jgi:hypothetical protein
LHEKIGPESSKKVKVNQFESAIPNRAWIELAPPNFNKTLCCPKGAALSLRRNTSSAPPGGYLSERHQHGAVMMGYRIENSGGNPPSGTAKRMVPPSSSTL